MNRESNSGETIDAAGPARWLRSIGPGLVTACVVIGPGSILTSSKVGATHGYGMSWVVVAAVVFMLAYMTLGARLGVVTGQSAGDLVTRTAGRPLAVLIGLGVFLISAAYQFGNNLGVDSAVRAYVAWDWTVVVFNAIAIAFLFAFKNLYQALERLMSVFVGLMLLAFAVNLGFALLNQTPAAARAAVEAAPVIDLSLLGLVGTTFVITAAYYQSYLVQFRGWSVKDLKLGLIDARVGSVLMALITLMIMWNAAAVFYGRLSGDDLASVGDVAAQLESAFGPKGRALFCLGLFSAAYSSFLVNSMIGGFILADGLGLGSKPNELWPRLFTVAVLLTGMGVALYVIRSGQKPVAAIVAAQAITVLAAPLMAGTLWWLTSKRDLMGEHVNGPGTHVLAGLGFLILLGMAYRLVTVEIPKGLESLGQKPAVTLVHGHPISIRETLR
ncbi:MAG: NRAMP family divalent metal transporter [Planctomycetaceae bacterium]